jgi:hypothetical protein
MRFSHLAALLLLPNPLAMGLVVMPQDGVDAGLVAFALGLEPAEQIMIELEIDRDLVRMDDLGFDPVLVVHWRAVSVGGGDRFAFRGRHQVEVRPVGLSRQRHEAAVGFPAVRIAVYQDGPRLGRANLGLAHSAVAPACWPVPVQLYT